MNRKKSCLALLAIAWLGGPATAAVPVPQGAFDEGAFHAGEARVEARLLLHPDAADPARQRVGILFELDPGWHLYWRNPGASGLAPELEWQVEGDARVGAIEWPAPAPFLELEGEITTYGYADRVLLATDLSWDGAAPEHAKVRVRADVLICEHECIPGRLELERRLSSRGADPRVRQLFEDARGELPQRPEQLGIRVEAGLAEAGAGVLRAELSIDPCPGEGRCNPVTFPVDGPAFFPDERSGLEIERIEAEVHPRGDGSLLLALTGTAEREDLHLSGVLALRTPDGPRHVAIDLPLRARGARPGVTLPVALGLALLGGLVLNLMPCVLPVLAIKVFAAVELSAHDRREVLRGAGTSLGWGFQLQEPLFVVAVAVVLVIFAMNLFGAFEIHAGTGRLAGVGTQATGAQRSFFEGLLAVVLATPCSAPFLGTAVGFAFAAPPTGIVSIFLAIGLGLAAPFVLVAWAPSFSRWIPRSGAWMLKLRAGLGFALLGTVVWLVWVFGRFAGADGVATLLSLLLAVAFATWLLGLAQGGSRPRLAVAAATTLAAVVLGGVGLLRVTEGEAARPASSPASSPEWRPYLRRDVEAALEAGQRVFVTFTADWCITCKVNERLVLSDERVRNELDRLGFLRFRADWTRRDDSIRKELARFGKAGVPLYLVYDPETPDQPTLLPELLTTERVLDALRGNRKG